jgi:hypothetical protein
MNLATIRETILETTMQAKKEREPDISSFADGGKVHIRTGLKMCTCLVKNYVYVAFHSKCCVAFSALP